VDHLQTHDTWLIALLLTEMRKTGEECFSGNYHDDNEAKYQQQDKQDGDQPPAFDQ